jgi:glutathione S-transferase
MNNLAPTRKIYGLSKSRALRCLWMAEELGLAFEHETTGFTGGASRTPQMLALNPNGHIPVLVDGDVIVWESLAINLYLMRCYAMGDKAYLGPQNPEQEAAILQWSFWAITECERDAVTVILHTVVLPTEKRDPSFALKAARRLHTPLTVLEAHLNAQLQATGQRYLCAGRFTTADLNLASILLWIKPNQDLCAQFPNVMQWLDLCMGRPSFTLARVRP